MNLLIVGGTGNISWRFSKAALDAGWAVTLLNRGGVDRERRGAPQGCETITANIYDPDATQEALGIRRFDTVVDFVCYNASQAQRAVFYFTARTNHYVFISTTALYDRAVARAPLTEESPIISKGWDYAMNKSHAEQVFSAAFRQDAFPVTIIRPGHTYDTIIPDSVGDGDWTIPWRLLNGKPIVVHGDGTTLWTLTHSIDFANGLVEFLKSGHAPGDIVNITADTAYNWREITAALCREVGVSDPKICYRTTEEINSIAPRYGNGLKGHKMWCDVYDNKKLKELCPTWRTTVSLEDGLKETVRYFKKNDKLLRPQQPLDSLLDSLCALRPPCSGDFS